MKEIMIFDMFKWEADPETRGALTKETLKKLHGQTVEFKEGERFGTVLSEEDEDGMIWEINTMERKYCIAQMSLF